MVGKPVPVESRFWQKVNRADGCWVWTAAITPTGYGVIGVNGGRRYAHRVAWEMANGPIPTGLFVCHTCDTPPCVRLSHLFLGTAGDNNRDCAAKGRSSTHVHPEIVHRGEAHYKAKLTDDTVREIRMLYAAGVGSQRQLAARFGVSKFAIHAAVTGKSWLHV